LLCEVLPRALLAELAWRVSAWLERRRPVLVVLPGEAREAAENFLGAAARQISELSSGIVESSGRHRQPGRLGRDPQTPQRRTAGQTQRAVRPCRPQSLWPRVPLSNSAPTPILRRNSAPNCARRRASLGRLDSGKSDGRRRQHAGASLPIFAGWHPAGAPCRALRRRQSARPGANLARRAQGRSIWGVLRGDVDNSLSPPPRPQH